jgi:ferric-dicitrate binding protein FerR (iron transport regulator)/tetratricopeptide (TPR) repeat protein
MYHGDLPPDPAADLTDVGELNVERLLGAAYQPENPDPCFARELTERLCAAARPPAARAAVKAPAEDERLRTVRRRLTWAMAAAACVATVALVLYARQDRGAPPPDDSAHHGGPDAPPQVRQARGESGPHFAMTPRPRPEAPAARPLAVGEGVSTRPGERRRVTLADGSVLYLNQSTRVTQTAARRLSLGGGEIYLEVAPREQGATGASFVVETPQRKVSALGTRFAVRAEAAGTGVLVTQGTVRVAGVKAVVQAGQQLAPGAAEVAPAPRASHRLDWTRELMAAAESPLVPCSKHAGGALIALDPNGQEMRLSLRKYHIDVHIEDGFARTTIDQTYFNNETSQLEGTFYFPLPPDASLSRLAMYVEAGGVGRLMEGGMAEANLARDAYESIRYARRDPALLEWVDGSTFKMRVFPLEGRKEKRIILSYTQRLPALYGVARYRFPGGHNMDFVREWSFAARVKNAEGLLCASPTHPKMQTTRQGKDLLLSVTERNVKPDRDVGLDLSPQAGAAEGSGRLAAFTHENARYLMVRYLPRLEGKPRRERRDWVILFESGANRDPLLARAQIEVVRGLLTNAEHDDTFSILTAGTRVRLFDKKPRANTPENVEAAVKFLEGTHLIGALDLGRALTEAKWLLQAGKNPHLVHVGAGTPAMGERREDALAKLLPDGARYVGVGVGKRWNRAFMKLAAERTDGYFAQINPDEPLAWRSFDLLATLNTPRLLQLRVVDDAERVPFLCDAASLAQGEEVCAFARVEGKDGKLPETVTISGKLDGKPFVQHLSVKGVAEGAGYLPRTWAKLEIDRLLAEDGAKHKNKIIELSKAMYVMSPYTSLLVLETEADYARFKVDRGRKDHWAMYPCPDKIPVVYEPLPGWQQAPVASGKQPTAEEVLRSVLVRGQVSGGDVPRWAAYAGHPELWGEMVTKTGQQMKVLEMKDITTVRRARMVEYFKALGGKVPPDLTIYLREPSAVKELKELAENWGKLPDAPRLPRGNEFQELADELEKALRTRVRTHRGPSTVFDSGLEAALLGARATKEGARTYLELLQQLKPADPQLLSLEEHAARTVTRDTRLKMAEELEPLVLLREYDLLRRQFDVAAAGGTLLRASIKKDKEVAQHRQELLLLAKLLKERKQDPASFRVPVRLSEAQRIHFAPVFVSPTMQWAIPNSMLTGPAWGPPHFNFGRGTETMADYDRPFHRLQINDIEDGFRRYTLADERFILRLHHLRSKDEAPPWQTSLLYLRPEISRDARAFGDLVSYAPGLSTTAADLRAVLEAEGPRDAANRPGTIDPAVRALIEKARGGAWQAVTFPGKGKRPDVRLLFTAAGQFFLDRVLENGLREVIVCDGTMLRHLYPELGLGARRTVSRFHRADLPALLPWLLPPVEDLARGADVTRLDASTVAVSPRDAATRRTKEGKPVPYLQLRLTFAGDGRLGERRLVLLPEGKVLSRETYAADGTVKLYAGDKEKPAAESRFHLAAAEAPDLAPDTSRLVVVPMPLRTVQHILYRPSVQKAEKANLGWEDWPADDAIARIASDCASGDTNSALRMFAARFHARADRRLGFYTLLASASCGVDPRHTFYWGKEKHRFDVAQEHPGKPLAVYLAYHFETLTRGVSTELGPIGGPAKGFVQQMAAFRDLHRRYERGLQIDNEKHSLTPVQVEQFVGMEVRKILAFAKNAPPQFAWPLLELTNQRVSARHPRAALPLAEAARDVAPAVGMGYSGRYEHARALSRAGRHDQAEAELHKLYAETLKAGVLPPVDQDIRNILVNVKPGVLDWKALMRQTARQLAREGDLTAVLALAEQVRQVGDPAVAEQLYDVAREVAPARQRPLLALAAVQHLSKTGQHARAAAQLEPLLKDKRLGKSPALWRLASELAGRQHLAGRAVAYLEKALALEYRDLPDVVNLKKVRDDHSGLLTQYQQIANALTLLEKEPAREFVAKVVRAADRWRALDPDGTAACQAAGKILRTLGAKDLAWDYLTTPVGLKPGEAGPWVDLAGALKGEGEFDLADRAYATAFEAEQTNAQILWDRAQNLQQVGRLEEARRVYRQLAEGTWQERFRRLQQQARGHLDGR